EFGHDGHGHGELHSAQALQGLDHWLQSPGLDLLSQFLLQALEAFGVLMDRADILLEDNLLSRGGTDHFGEPPQMGRPPGGTARIADIVPEQKGFEPELGGLEITDGVFTSPTEVTDGFAPHPRDIDGSEVT